MLGLTLLTMLALANTEHVVHADGETVLEVRIHGVKENTGSLRVSVYSGAEGFPGELRKAVARGALALSDQTRETVLRFPGLEAGRYAVSVHHDENGNGEFDTNWIGIPKEGYDASRDARGSFGPPKYEDAVFRHAGTRTVLNVTLAYRDSSRRVVAGEERA